MAQSLHPDIEFRTGDAEALPFGDASFEAVIANFGIHHVEHPERAMAEARRVLTPGGAFAFTFWADRQENAAWRIIFDAIAACGRLGLLRGTLRWRCSAGCWSGLCSVSPDASTGEPPPGCRAIPGGCWRGDRKRGENANGAKPREESKHGDHPVARRRDGMTNDHSEGFADSSVSR